MKEEDSNKKACTYASPFRYMPHNHQVPDRYAPGSEAHPYFGPFGIQL